jgi:hypothetical protein
MDETRGGRDPGYFGPGVIGAEQYEREKKEVENLSTVFGPGVTGIGTPNPPVNKPGPGVTGQCEEAPAAGAPETPSLSIAKLEEALEDNPALVDSFLPLELARPGGPRKGALQALEIAEQLRPDGAREDVLTQIAAALPNEE